MDKNYEEVFTDQSVIACCVDTDDILFYFIKNNGNSMKVFTTLAELDNYGIIDRYWDDDFDCLRVKVIDTELDNKSFKEEYHSKLDCVVWC
jgi:hypothetical protein